MAPGYRVEEIAKLAGVTPRAVRYYVELGLLPPPKFRGTATLYTEEQLWRLKAIPILRKKERLRLEGVKRRLNKMSAEEVTALVGAAAGAAGAGGVVKAEAAQERPAINAVAMRTGAGVGGGYPGVGWERVELLPGLELSVRSDAGPLLRRLAGEIYELYGAGARAGAGASKFPDESPLRTGLPDGETIPE